MTPLDALRRYPPHGGSLTGLLRSRVAVQGDAPCLVAGDQVIAWSALEERVAATAGALVARGVGPGDRVATLSPTRPEVVLAMLACARLGAWLVPTNPGLHADSLRHVLHHAGVCGVLCDVSLREAAADAAPDGAWVEDLALPGGEPVTEVRGGPDDVCMLVYTSGTTGPPKGVMHTQRSVVLAAEGFVQRMRLVPDDRLLVVLPLYHVNGLLYSVGGTLAAGAAAILAPRFSASGFWRLAAESGATEVNVIAAMGNILAQRPRSEWVPHRLQKVYCAPITPSMERTFREDFDIPMMVEGYGMTEVPGVITNPFPGHGTPRAGTMGLAATHPDPAIALASLRVVDDSGADVPDGVTGELWVRTPMAMAGYHRDPDATAAAFVDGWFRTGDLVHRDDGYVTFVARGRDIIRRRGENIAGAELDRALASHPDVLLCAAIGVPSPLGEDDILVAVVPAEGRTLTAAAVRAWMADRLARYKVPRYVLFRDDLPRTPTHRVAKHTLKAEGAALIAAADDAGG